MLQQRVRQKLTLLFSCVASTFADVKKQKTADIDSAAMGGGAPPDHHSAKHSTKADDG